MPKTTFFKRVQTVVNKGLSFVFGDNQFGRLFSFVGGSTDEDSGQEVTPETGSGISIVYACLNNLAQDFTTLPKQLKRNTSQGVESIHNKFTHVLNQRPNKWENAWVFWYGMMFVGEGWGNSYAYIKERDSTGYASELIRIKPWLVTCEIVEGELYYIIDNKVSIHSSDMLHYRSMVTSSPIGESKIVYNAKTIGLKLKQQKYTTRSIGNKPPGILSSKEATDEQMTANKKTWDAQISGDNIAGTPVMRGDVEYKSLMLDPKAAQIVLQHGMSDQWIMSIWRMQPSMLSKDEKTSYNLAEQQNINHVRYALVPLVVNWEQEMNNKLLPAGNSDLASPEYIKCNVKGLLRGDTATQTAFYNFLRTGGIANADEIRAWEDMPPQKDEKGQIGIGQKYFIQGAMVEIGKDPDDTKESDEKTFDLLDKFARQHKLNGYAHES